MKNKIDFYHSAMDKALNEEFYEAYLILRNNFNLSELNRTEILQLLLGRSSIKVFHDDFEVVNIPNIYYNEKMNSIKNKYNNYINIQNEYYEKIESIDLDFFNSLSPRKFNEGVIYNSSLLKNFIFSIKGDYFIIHNNHFYFLNKVYLPKFNIFNDISVNSLS